MCKHIPAQHNIWRLQETLKSYLKPWEVLCTGLKEPKCSLLMLFCALTLNFSLQRKSHKIPNWQFCTDFHGGNVAMSFCFALQCHVRHLMYLGSSFLLPSPMVLNLKRRCTGRSLHCYPPPATCTSAKCSPSGMQILHHVYRYMWPTRNFWTPVAPLGTAGYWAALQNAINPIGCQEGGFHPPLNTTALWTQRHLFKELLSK